MIAISHIAGQDKGNILLYSLSTCSMCKSVKNILNNLNVEYGYIDVDLLEGEDKEIIKAEMRRWNVKCPFPMIVINNKNCVIGNEPEIIKEAIEKAFNNT